MTTFLATKERGEGPFSEYTYAFCSDQCRVDHTYAEYYRTGTRNTSQRDDDSYEFDEVCANCGALVSASH